MSVNMTGDRVGYLLVCEDLFDNSGELYWKVGDACGLIQQSYYDNYFVVAGLHLPSDRWRAVVGVFAMGPRKPSMDFVLERVMWKFLRTGNVRIVSENDLRHEAQVTLQMDDWKEHTARVALHGERYHLASQGGVNKRFCEQYRRALEGTAVR